MRKRAKLNTNSDRTTLSVLGHGTPTFRASNLQVRAFYALPDRVIIFPLSLGERVVVNERIEQAIRKRRVFDVKKFLPSSKCFETRWTCSPRFLISVPVSFVSAVAECDLE